MAMILTRRTMIPALAAVPAVSLAGCGRPHATLQQVFTPATDKLVDGAGKEIEVGTLLASLAGRTVTVSFGYLGCGGSTPRIKFIKRAIPKVDGIVPYHVVIDAVDDVSRFPEVERDILGPALECDAADTRLIFVKRDSWAVRQNNRTVYQMLQAMSARYGEDSYLQSIRWVALFTPDGVLDGLYW